VTTRRPLRKLLRYRDQTGASLSAHTEHWRDFEWDAGPVCVIHKGAAWGTPQVWAASAAEGKRVIRHAGEIAGVDPDSDGQWIITGSTDPRYGRTGRMGIRELQPGSVAVTKRDGPNEMPLVQIVDP
jgi:hypothetical protein